MRFHRGEGEKGNRRRFLEGLPERNVVDKLVALDEMDHDNSPGWRLTSEGFRGFMDRFLTAVPNLRARVEDIVSEEDRVAARVTFIGRVVESIPGFISTGESLTVTAISIFRIKERKVVEHWGLMGTPNAERD